jgi:hypothetical protein
MQNNKGEFFAARGNGASSKVANAPLDALARIVVLVKKKARLAGEKQQEIEKTGI